MRELGADGFVIACKPCRGNGYYWPDREDRCGVCDGLGAIRVPGNLSDYVECSTCGGNGFHYPYPKRTCERCAGTGLVRREGIRTVSPPSLAPTPVPVEESVRQRFDRIEEVLSKSNLEPPLREIAIYDLGQAEIAYNSKAYKACIVMLGAVLEGIMLGTLRRADVLQSMQANAPGVIQSFPHGLGHPGLGNWIADKLSFEDYKNAIKHLIPDLEKRLVEDIQDFRNSVHPWKAIQQPRYGEPDEARAMHYTTALEMLAHHILTWKP